MDLLRTFTLSAWFGFHKAFRESKQPHASREVSTTTLAHGDTNRASQGITCRIIGDMENSKTKAPSQFTSLSWRMFSAGVSPTAPEHWSTVQIRSALERTPTVSTLNGACGAWAKHYKKKDKIGQPFILQTCTEKHRKRICRVLKFDHRGMPHDLTALPRDAMGPWSQLDQRGNQRHNLHLAQQLGTNPASPFGRCSWIGKP